MDMKMLASHETVNQKVILTEDFHQVDIMHDLFSK